MVSHQPGSSNVLTRVLMKAVKPGAQAKILDVAKQLPTPIMDTEPEGY